MGGVLEVDEEPEEDKTGADRGITHGRDDGGGSQGGIRSPTARGDA